MRHSVGSLIILGIGMSVGGGVAWESNGRAPERVAVAGRTPASLAVAAPTRSAEGSPVQKVVAQGRPSPGPVVGDPSVRMPLAPPPVKAPPVVGESLVPKGLMRPRFSGDRLAPAIPIPGGATEGNGLMELPEIRTASPSRRDVARGAGATGAPSEASASCAQAGLPDKKATLVLAGTQRNSASACLYCDNGDVRTLPLAKCGAEMRR